MIKGDHSILDYLKDRLGYILLMLVVLITIVVVLLLYNIHFEPILYSEVICLFVVLISAILDYKRYKAHHRLLLNLHKQFDGENIQIIDKEGLPTSTTAIEASYISLVEDMIEASKRATLSMDKSQTELMDYYTLWAHQIKTPIAAMKLLLQAEERGENKELLNQLFRIEQYVEMVLCFLKLESATSDLLIKKHQLDSIVKQSIKKYATIFIHQKTVLEMDQLEVSITTDEKWLVFALEQILSNALKYTDQGKISIYLAEKGSPAYEQWFHVSHKDADTVLVVEDTGIGISREDLPRIFEKGFTGYNGRSDKKATGIGLYLTKKILTKLNHEIYVDAQQGKGTTVFISL